MVNEVLEPAYFNLPGVAAVTWDPASRAVRLEVKGWADSTESAAVFDAVLRALTQHGGSLWLADCRNLKVVKQSDQEWINRDWFPRALALGLRRIAVVVPTSGLAKMNVADMVERAPHTVMEVCYFATVEQATEWLVQPPTSAPI